MLLDKAFPVLAIAMDNSPDFYNEAAETISISDSAVSESEILSGLDRLNQFFYADVTQKQNRIYIPITDKLLPVHFTGGNSASGKVVTYQGDEPTITEAGNTVTLQFEMLNAMSQLSIISDILYAIANKTASQPTTSARVSFFSPTLCIYNAYMVGINRATVTATDKEVISITLEIAVDEVPPAETEETPISEIPLEENI